MPRHTTVISFWMIITPRFLLLCVSSAMFGNGLMAADEVVPSDLPRVVIVGDSIRLSYAPTVVKHLAGKALVVSPAANSGDSSNLLKHLDQWVIGEKPAVVHFNCGIHDTKKFTSTGRQGRDEIRATARSNKVAPNARPFHARKKESSSIGRVVRFQVSAEQYEANLREIVERIRKETGAVVLFATTTPILDDRAAEARRDREYELLDASVRQYNRIAKKVMRELDVPVNDLYAGLTTPGKPSGMEDLIGSDGVHLQPEAKERIGKVVADFVASHLPSRQR